MTVISEGGSTTPTGKQPDSSLHTNNVKLINTRGAAYKDMGFWSMHPDQTAKLLTSNIPEDHHDTVASYTPEMSDWIARRESFGGVNGALIGVRLKALAIADPELRQRELVQINDIAKLSPGEQAVFIAYMRDPAAFAGTTALEQGRAQPGVAQVLGPSATADPTTGEISVTAGETSVDQVVALEQLFPSLQGKIHFADGRGVTLQDYQESYLQNFQAIGQQGINPLSIAEDAFSVFLRGGMVPFQAVGHGIHGAEGAFQSAASAAGFGGAAQGVVSNWEGITGAGYRRFNRAMDTTSSTLGRLILEGRVPGTEVLLWHHHDFAEETQKFVGGIALAASLHGVSEAAGSITQQLGVPSEAFAEARGVGGPAGLAGTVADLSLGEIAKHPFRGLIDPLIQKSTFDVVQQIHGTSWADWVQRSQAGGVFDFIARHSAEADGLAKMRERYPMLPEDYLRRMMNTTRENMPQLTLDYADEVALGKTSAGARAQQSSLQAKLNAQTAATDAARTAWEDAGRPTQSPAPVDPVVVADLHNILAEHRSPTADLKGGYLDQAGVDSWTKELSRVSKQGRLVDTTTGEIVTETQPNNVYRYERQVAGQPEAYYVAMDAEGKVVSVRTASANGSAIAETTEAGSGQGYGKRLLLQHWKDLGITDLTDPAQLVRLREILNEGQFSDAGIALNESGIRTLLGKPDELGILLGEGRKLKELQIQKIAVDQQVAEIAARPSPILRFPGRNTLPDFMHRVLYRPATLSERVFRTVLNFRDTARFISGEQFLADGAWLAESRVPTIAKLVDKLSNEDRLVYIDPNKSGVERAFLEDQNTTILNRLLGKFKVSNADAAALQQAFADARTQAEWFDVVNNKLFGHTGVLSRYLADNIPADFRERILGTSTRDPLDYNHSVSVKSTSGGSYTEPVLPGEVVQGVARPLPSAPSEFSTQASLPSMNAIENALSGARRWSRNMHDAAAESRSVAADVKSGIRPVDDLPGARSRLATAVGDKAAYVLDFGRASLHLSTVGLKAPALLFNLPAIILTKVLDETVGNANTPGLSRVIRTPAGALDYVMRIDPADLGSNISGFFGDASPIARFTQDVAAAQLLSKGGDSAVFGSMIQRLNQIHDDPMLNAFARTGLDIDQMRALLQGGDESLTRFFNEQVAPQLEKAGMDMDAWLGRWADSIREATLGGDPRWMAYAGEGKLKGGARTLRLTDGSEAHTAYSRTLGDIEALNNSLKDMNARTDGALIKRTQDVLKSKYEQLRNIEAEVQAQGGTVEFDKVIRADREHPDAAVGELRRQFNNNEITLPDRIRVDRVARDGIGPQNIIDHMNKWSESFGQFMYGRTGKFSFQAIGRAEGRTARGNFYTQQANLYTKQAIGLGVSEAEAQLIGHFRALEQTRDMFYDLTARSSMERSVRNVFWFAPVNAELLYRWLYAIPAQSGGLIPGAAILLSKAANYESLARDLGIVQTDPITGQDVIVVPGLSKLVSGLTGGAFRIGDINQIPVTSLSPHLSSPIPQLAPIPAAALNKVAEYIPVIRDLSSVVSPYSNVTFIPNSIRNALGIAGIKTPDFSQDYVNQTWDRNQDTAYQLAFWSLQKEGDKAPSLADFHLDPAAPGYSLTDANQTAYEAAWGEWFTRLSARQKEYARGTYALKLFQGAVLPGTIQSTTKDQQDFKAFWQNQIMPKLADGTAMSQQTRDLIDQWLGAHPDSLAFSVSYNYYTGKTWQPTYSETSDQQYRDYYLHGVKATMTPQEYSQVLPAMVSRAMYTARTNAAIEAISPSGDPTELLRHWGTRAVALANGQIAWDNYLITHPQADGIIKTHEANMQNQFGIVPNSIESHYVKDALLSMKALADHFTGEGGLSTQEYTGVLGQLKALNAKLYKDTGGDLTPLEQGISWYFDSVLTPYMDRTQPLYTQAAKLAAQGKDASAIYAQIASIKAEYDNPKNGGKSYPSPDEFFYGSKSPQMQELTRINWTTKPVAWLSDFQRRTLGYTAFKGEAEMFATSDAIDQQVQDAIDQNNVSPGSRYYDQLKTWAQNAKMEVAQKYGQAGVDAMTLNLQDPYVRLKNQNYGSGNASMQQTYTMAQQIHDALRQNGLSASGYSDYAIQLKQWLYGYIVQQEAADPQFKALMQQLSLAQTPLPSGQHPQAVPLWESIYFGNFNPDFISQDLINSVPNGAI